MKEADRLFATWLSNISSGLAGAAAIGPLAGATLKVDTWGEGAFTYLALGCVFWLVVAVFLQLIAMRWVAQ